MRAPTLVAALALLLPTPLWAETCPATPEDSAQGITVAFDDGSHILSTRDPATGIVTEDWTFPDGMVIRVHLTHALYPVDFQILQGGATGAPTGLTTYSFDTPPLALTKAGQSFTSPYTATVEGEALRGTYTVTTAPPGPVTYGDCLYDAIPVTILQQEPGDTLMQHLDLIPTLGLSILRAEGESLSALTLHNPVSITLQTAP
jgi:hypothetical protein